MVPDTRTDACTDVCTDMLQSLRQFSVHPARHVWGKCTNVPHRHVHRHVSRHVCSQRTVQPSAQVLYSQCRIPIRIEGRQRVTGQGMAPFMNVYRNVYWLTAMFP